MYSAKDKFAIYEESVQAADTEVDFITQCFKLYFRRNPSVLREDFCGSAWLCAEWIKLGRNKQAFGIDINSEVLAWGMERHIQNLSPSQQRRIELINGDVLEVQTKKADIIAALNFSYWTLRERDILKAYFINAYNNLNHHSMLVLDIFSGSEAGLVKVEKRKYTDFTYIWSQEYYNPLNGDFTCSISFEFEDQPKMSRVFEYHWRLWTPPEIKDLLYEAGFNEISFFLRESDSNGYLTGNTEEVSQINDPDLVWLAYIVAIK
jgi:hypothetical protein